MEFTDYKTDQLPKMRGDANMARGATYFEVPLFSHVIDNLWQGCSPSEFPDVMEPYNYDLNRVNGYSRDPKVIAVIRGDVSAECRWLWESGDESTGYEVYPRFDKILNLFKWGKYEVPEGTEQVTVTMHDGESDEFGQLDELADLVFGWLQDGHRVLVHCQAGLNRSSLVVAYTLIKKFGMTPEAAIKKVRDSRSQMCLCNDSFRHFLKGLA